MRAFCDALVTGGAGLIGSHLVDSLLADGKTVAVVDDFSTGSKENLKDHPNLKVITADVRDPDACWKAALRYGEVWHLACPASPVRYQEDPIKTLTTAVMGTLNALALARKMEVTLLHASTSEVYGDPACHPQREDYWGNVNPVGTRACYDEGKRAAEALCADTARLGSSVRVARIFNTYGPRMSPDDGRVVSNFVTQALRGKPLTVYGDGSQTRSLCFVDDTVRGLRRLMASAVTGPVNVGNASEVTVLQLARTVIEVAKSKSRIIHQPLPSDDPRRRRPDLTRARSTLGWEAEVTLRVGLERTVAYFRSLND